MTGGVALRYARAFADVAESARLDASQLQQQLGDFSETLAGSHELREFLMNPSVGMPEKLRLLDALAGRMGLGPQVRNFLAVIVEHQRLLEFDEIRMEYREIADEHMGAVEATVTSAHPLSDDLRAELESQVAKLAGAKVRASYAEDPSLLGGAVVQIGSTIYDGSLRAQLGQLKSKLVNA